MSFAGLPKLCRPTPLGFVLTLNANTFDAVAEIQKLKRVHSAPIVAFLSHVQVDLKRRAEEAGAAEVLPRSVFVQRLAQLLS